MRVTQKSNKYEHELLRVSLDDGGRCAVLCLDGGTGPWVYRYGFGPNRECFEYHDTVSDALRDMAEAVAGLEAEEKRLSRPEVLCVIRPRTYSYEETPFWNAEGAGWTNVLELATIYPTLEDALEALEEAPLPLFPDEPMKDWPCAPRVVRLEDLPKEPEPVYHVMLHWVGRADEQCFQSSPNIPFEGSKEDAEVLRRELQAEFPTHRYYLRKVSG